jgi:hypothetical protein
MENTVDANPFFGTHNTDDYARRLENFTRDLERIININSMENESNTPDFMIARYLCDCLHAYNNITMARDARNCPSP